MYRLPVWQESMKKNQQDVEVLKPELEHLDWDVRPKQAINEFKSFGVYRECANPECETEFHWLARGTFFRFRPGDASARENKSNRDAPTKHHGVRHYWLCKCCSVLLTLVCREHRVVLRPRWL